MYPFAIVSVLFVACRFVYDILVENYRNNQRDNMYQDRIQTEGRKVVIQGMFRQHNQAFRDKGFKPPQGTA